ncbi:hypothetical protein BV898_03115 [Hypsibius exemplaris]|uniref:Uncharacterized protein n=1 Tax=Hypsibius exemplaris TaxID=2072580 RepID=A0A1W0X6B6_HYPEX|nr:hypothetical protein BV898_03115 [Hypsibius exemplaris]
MRTITMGGGIILPMLLVLASAISNAGLSQQESSTHKRAAPGLVKALLDNAGAERTAANVQMDYNILGHPCQYQRERGFRHGAWFYDSALDCGDHGIFPEVGECATKHCALERPLRKFLQKLIAAGELNRLDITAVLEDERMATLTEEKRKHITEFLHSV